MEREAHEAIPGLRAVFRHKPFTTRHRVRRLLNGSEGLRYGERRFRFLRDSATRLWLASALLLATNLIWILAVALNLLGPLGPLTAGVLGWLALGADLPGVALLAAAYAGLTREQGRASSPLRSAIVWGFAGWVALSAYWRFAVPLVTGTDVQGLFAGMLGGNPAMLTLAKNAWATVEEIFVAWITAAGLFFVVHILIAVDYRRASAVEWTAGIPAYAWLVGTGLSFVSTILIVAALLPVLGGGFLGSTFTAGAIGKLLVAPNIMLSGYASSVPLGRAAKAARRAGDGG